MLQKKNKIKIQGKEIEVKPKDITFFDIQSVAPIFANSDLNFSSYWDYAFRNWLQFDTDVDINILTPAEGNQLASLLPSPTDVMGWLAFREAGSVKLSTMSMGDQ